MNPFGNNAYDNYTAKPHVYEPKWEKQIDYNPDHRPSDSRCWIENRDDSAYEVLQVAGLGALVLRVGYDADGKLVDKGVSEFTDGEIGWRV